VCFILKLILHCLDFNFLIIAGCIFNSSDPRLFCLISFSCITGCLQNEVKAFDVCFILKLHFVLLRFRLSHNRRLLCISLSTGAVLDVVQLDDDCLSSSPMGTATQEP